MIDILSPSRSDRAILRSGHRDRVSATGRAHPSDGLEERWRRCGSSFFAASQSTRWQKRPVLIPARASFPKHRPLPALGFGIGATIGTGIFFVLSEAVPVAGPAVILSFVFAGAVAGLTAVCYAELASAVPVSGSSYSYTYATMGEIAAMGVAACLLLEYGVSAGAVAVGWSQYLNQFLDNVFDYEIPEAAVQAAPGAGRRSSTCPR